MKHLLRFLCSLLRNPLRLANIAEGTHEGSLTRKTDTAVPTRFLLARVGSNADHVDICGAANVPIGVFTDEAAAAGAFTALDLLGVSRRTTLLVASEAIDAGKHLYTAANGKVQDLPTAAGTYYEVGIALTSAAADGDLLEASHCLPRKTIVT